MRLQHWVVCLCAICGALACGSQPSTEPATTATATPAPAESPATAAVEPTPAVTAARTYASLNDLLVPPGPDVQVAMESDFGGQYAAEPRYMEMFGGQHVRMIFQQVVINGEEGTLTYVEFADEAAAAQAAAKVAAGGGTPKKGLQFGKYMVVVQPSGGDLDGFSQRAKDRIEK